MKKKAEFNQQSFELFNFFLRKLYFSSLYPKSREEGLDTDLKNIFSRPLKHGLISIWYLLTWIRNRINKILWVRIDILSMQIHISFLCSFLF